MKNKVFKSKFGCTLFEELCTWPGYAGTTTNLQIVLNIKKKIPIKIKPTKNIVAKFFYPE